MSTMTMQTTAVNSMRIACALSALVAVSAPMAARSADYWYVGSSNVWDRAEAYSQEPGGPGGAGVPGPGDAILLGAGQAAYLDEASVAYLNGRGIERIRYRGSDIRVHVHNEAAAALAFGCGDSSEYAWTNCVVVKTGGGFLTFDKRAPLHRSDYNTGIDLRAGELQLGPSTGRYDWHAYGGATLAAGTTLWCVTNGTTAFRGGIFGSGTLTNRQRADGANNILTSVQFDPRPDKTVERSDFAGVITGFGKVRQAADFWYRGTANTFDDFYCVGNCDVGFVAFHGSGATSLGNPYSAGFPLRNGTCLRYLGDGGENATRGFKLLETAVAPSIDAGVGGLTVSSHFNLADGKQQRLALTGTNAAESVFSASVGRAIGAGTGRSASLCLTKRGSGVWRLSQRPDVPASKLISGVIGVVGGTLAFDTVCNAGLPCALGTASDLYGDVCDSADSMDPVPYAIFCGGDVSEATLSYLGSDSPFVYSRPIAVCGLGRLVAANCEALAWKGIRGLGVGEKRLTFACEARQRNAVADVTDAAGGAEGTLTVVKDGPGDLDLSGELSFGGDLLAKGGGTLRVRDISGATHRYYRLTIKETAAGSPLPEYAGFSVSTGTSSANNLSRSVLLGEFGLYDGTGLRLNAYAPAATNSSVATLSSAHSAMEDASLLHFEPRNNTVKHVGYLSDCDTGSGMYFQARWLDNTKYPACDAPSTWMKAVVRLPETAPAATSFDLNYVAPITSPYAAGQPTAFSVEGSPDGLNWTELYSTNNVVFQPPDYYFWLSSMTSACTNSAAGGSLTKPESVAHGRIPFSSTTDTRKYAVLDNVRSIGAAAGTRLVFDGPRKAVRGLRVSRADGLGTIENFALADNGTLFVDDAEGATDFAILGNLADVEGLGNAAGWSLVIDGNPSRRQRFSVMKDGIRIFKKGFALIVR